MSYQTILVNREGGVATVTLNRPRVLNAMNLALSQELGQAIAELEADDDVRAIILTGAGERSFSAGADIHEMRALTPEQTAQAANVRGQGQQRVANCPKPIIGALNGLAHGGGAVLASSLDFLVGCERSQFRFLAVAYGQMNSTWTLPVLIGWPRAKELLYTGRVVEAEEAYRLGLLNHLVPADKLMDKAMELAQTIAANHPRSVQGVKGLIQNNLGRSWEEMRQREHLARRTTHQGLAVEEGFQEFIQRRGRPLRK
jgi:enoyl-CoA hydratase/carnithine racemase